MESAKSSVPLAVLPYRHRSSDLERSVARFTDEEVELLARLEHDRWVRDLGRDGWVYGQAKDPDGRPPTHPLMVSWHLLSEHDREKDRVAVRDMPQMLARAGFEVQRIPGGASVDGE